MKSKVLLKWPVARESDPDDVPYSDYRLVGVEPEPGIFEHVVEGLAKDSLGAASWRKLDDRDEFDSAIADLAWHLWSEDYVKARFSKDKKKKGG